MHTCLYNVIKIDHRSPHHLKSPKTILRITESIAWGLKTKRRRQTYAAVPNLLPKWHSSECELFLAMKPPCVQEDISVLNALHWNASQAYSTGMERSHHIHNRQFSPPPPKKKISSVHWIDGCVDSRVTATLTAIDRLYVRGDLFYSPNGWKTSTYPPIE